MILLTIIAGNQCANSFPNKGEAGNAVVMLEISIEQLHIKINIEPYILIVNENMGTIH